MNRLLCCRVLMVPMVLLGMGVCSAFADEPGSVRVRFTEQVRAEPFTGRVIVLFSKRSQEPRRGPSWFHPEPMMGLDVVDWKPGEVLSVGFNTPGVVLFPPSLKPESLEGLHVQAVARFNPHVHHTLRTPYERKPRNGPGNGFSPAAVMSLKEMPTLVIDQLEAEVPFRETDRLKLIEVPSKMLSQFHGRPVTIQAGVSLPESYSRETSKRYPVVFEIPGFSGSHHDIHSARSYSKNAAGVEFIQVMLNPNCGLGHHVFANSENNGPWGDALVSEFLPAFDKAFRTQARPGARVLTGHSSGGWSSLWLMTQYPDSFAATWSTAPDPVTFQDFQRIDLTKPDANMFITPDGEKRPLARMNGKTILWYRGFSDMENAFGPCGQLHSFEAVFSPRGSDGKPQLLWNRKTGAIDPTVAKSWKKYDIAVHLEENWDCLGPKLAGKLHVIMGTEDTFYLEGATAILKQKLAALGSDATIEMIPGKNHLNLLGDGVAQRIADEMAATVLKGM